MPLERIPLGLITDSNGVASGLGQFTLSSADLGDVCSNTPSQDQVLVYSGTQWCPSTLPAPGGGGGSFSCGDLSACALSSLGNVCDNFPAGSATINQFLVWNGTTWCPSALTIASAQAPLPNGAPGDVLVIPEGGSAFTDKVTSSTLFDNGLAANNLNTIGDVGYAGTPANGTLLARDAGVWKALKPDQVQQLLAAGDSDFGGSAGAANFDHGILSGLGDDDHTQYVLSAGTRAMSALTVNNNISTSGIIAKNVVPDSEDGLNILATNVSGQTSVSSVLVKGDTILGTNISATTSFSATSGSVASTPVASTNVANKSYVDGINNTQHNRLFAVGRKTDSIANTAVYLGWEFDVPNALSVSDSGGVITIGGTGNTEITFGEAGDYMIDCTARCNADNRVELFVKAEYYDATQESPAFATYNRLQNSNYAARDTDQNTGGTTLSLLLSLNQNDKLRFEAEGDSDGTAVLLVNGTFLRIVKLA